MVIRAYGSIRPQIAESAFIAETAVVIGDVVIGDGTSVWYGTVLRGDVNEIRVGCNTNIQDGTIVHVESGGYGTYIGDEVTIGHQAVLHACTLASRCFVGMQAMVMDGAHVEEGAMIGARALVTKDKHVKAGELWLGAPAKKQRDLSPDEIAGILDSARRYRALADSYRDTSTDSGGGSGGDSGKTPEA